MTSIERLSIQERCGKRNVSFQSDQKQTFRKTLIQKAKQVKQKIVQETNPHDYSIQKLMNETLKQLQSHKTNFQQQNKQLARYYQGEQYENKKTILKDQLLKRLQTCKNKYKKSILLIKSNKNRFYTSNDQNSSQQKISLEDMMKTVKNKFKIQRQQSRQSRNQSEIIQLKKPTQQDNFKFVQKSYPSQIMLKNKMKRKQNNIHPISIDMIKQKQVKNQISTPSIDRNRCNEQSPFRLHATQMISLPFQWSRKDLIQSIKKKRKLFPNGYFKVNSPQISNNDNLSNSERSVFVPVGKVALNNQRKKNHTSFQVTNSKANHKANKLSSEIVAEFVQIQTQQKNDTQKTRIFLPLNKKIKTEGNIKIKQKKPKIQNLTPIKTSRLQQQIKPHINSLLRSQPQYQKDSKNNYFQKDHQNQENPTDEVQCFISIHDLKVPSRSQKKREMIENGSNSGLKSILYHKKVNELSRKVIKNQMNSRLNKKPIVTQLSRDFQLQSRSMQLDIRGSQMRVEQSVKIEDREQWEKSQVGQELSK